MYHRIQKSSSWNHSTQQKNSQLTSRLFSAQAQQNSSQYSSQEEEKRQKALRQDNYEVSRLQLKAKCGTITSVEQKKLGVLQAKMKELQVQRREKLSRLGHSLANISITSPHKQGIQRNKYAEKAGRAKRIVARFFTKTLPRNTYRWDTRDPNTIAQEGFQPRNPGGNIRLDEHVNNVLNNGEVAKYQSQWVSTGAYGMLKKLDPTFAQQVLNTNLYKIDTTIAKRTGNFHDANDFFDKKGKKRPYASQREWAKLGGVPAAAIVKWMPGEDFFNQYSLENGAPDENALANWQDMPQPQQ